GRVYLICAGLQIGDTYAAVSPVLMYRHKDKQKALQDLVYIECTYKRRIIGVDGIGPVEERPPVHFIIDPNHNRLLRNDRSRYFETKKFDDNEIVASKDDE